MFEHEIAVKDFAEMEVNVVVQIVCKCGCGTVGTYEFGPRDGEIGSMLIWQGLFIELAVGLPCGIYEPRLLNALRAKGDMKDGS
jgi:hypothetical protein